MTWWGSGQMTGVGWEEGQVAGGVGNMVGKA
jgi:hypothetical protein